MKALFCKTALAVAVISIAGIGIQAQTLREEFSKEFQLTSSSELTVDNQFGNITVTTWDQNKVSIVVNVEVTHSDEAKAKKLLDKIKIDLGEEGNRIVAKTKFGEDNKLETGKKGEKQAIQINYFIKCPKNLKMQLDNQFGDIIVGSLSGFFSADLQFGSLSAVSLSGPETSIDMQFGKLTIGSVKDAKIDIQHCETIKIDEVGVLSIDAQLSELTIGTIQSLKADLNHCDVKINTLNESLKVSQNMGNVNVTNVSANFKSVVIDQNMGSLDIGFDPKAGYQLTAEVNMGSIKYPENLKVNHKKDRDLPGVTADKVTGTFGSGISTVHIDTNMGTVRIR
jgi:hypothetical protein